MAERTSLGGAEYTLDVDERPLIRGFAEAEAKAAASAKRLAGVVDSELKRVEAALGRVRTDRSLAITLDTRAAEQGIRQVQARLAGIKDETVELRVRPLNSGDALARLKREIATIEQRGVTLQVRTQEAARGQAATQQQQQRALRLPVTIEQRDVDAAVRRIEARLAALRRSAAIPVTAQTAQADQALRRTEARRDELRRPAVIPVTARAQQAESEFARLRRELIELRRGVTIPVRTQQQGGAAGAAAAAGGFSLGSSLGSFGRTVGAGVGIGTGIAAVQAGLHGVSEAYREVIDATVKAQQAQQALNIIYGDAAVLYQGIARQASAASTATLTSTQQVVTQFATLRANYGFTADQIERLTKLTLQYAAVTGKDVVDVAQRLQSALRGEAEAAEQLGLTLNSDAVKAFAAMTAEQRKNFETLDQVTKAQITYNELLRQSANVQKAAVNDTSTLQGSQAELAKQSENLSNAVGGLLTPAVIGFNQAAAGAAKATAEWITKLGELERARQRALPASEAEFGIGGVPGTGRNLIPSQPGGVLPQAEREAERRAEEDQRAAVAAAAEKARKISQIEEQAARDRLTRDIKYAEDGVRIREELTRNSIEQARREAEERQQLIEDTRDKDIAAVQAAAEADIAALDARQQAASDYYAEAISAVERQRDAELAAIEARKQAALRALEAERRALEQTRRSEDRAIEDRREAERRSIEATRAAVEQAFEAERRAIEANRDAALRALDERAAAEDRRHSEAMRNIEREEAAQLGVIDEELRKLDEQEERERRAETDRQQRQALAEARQAVKDADTPAERAAARRRLADVEREIAREQRRRQREDARAALRERAEQVRKEFEARKEQERQRHEQAQQQLEQEKQQLQEQTNAQLEALNQQLQSFQASQAAMLQALQDRYKQEDRARQDARDKEDRDFEARRQAIEDQADEEAKAVRGAADARISELRKAAQASDRYYAEEKRKARQSADDQIAQIRRVTDAQLRALRQQLQLTVEKFQRELTLHKQQADRLIELWRRALADVRGYIRAEVRIESGGIGSPPGANPVGTNWDTRPAGPGNTCPPGYQYYPGLRMCVRVDAQGHPVNLPSTSRQPQSRDIGGPIKRDELYRVHKDEVIAPTRDAYVVSLAEQRRLAAAMPEPSLLSAGYAGAARGGRMAAGPSYTTNAPRTLAFSPTINVDARGVAGAEGVADLVVARAAREVVRLLDRTERMHATAVDPMLGGAR